MVYSKFTLDKFIATWVISGAIYYSPRAFAPLLFSGGFNYAARYGFNSLVKDGKWGIKQKTADSLTRYFSIFSSISVEYFRPPFQTGLSNYLDPKYATIGGKILALGLGNIVSDIYKSIAFGEEKKEIKDGEIAGFPILTAAAKYLLFLSIRELGDQVFPKVYGFKPFGVLFASCVMYRYMAKTSDDGNFEDSRLQYISKKTLDFVYNQIQLKALVKIPPFHTEKLFRYMVSDFGKRVFADCVIKPFCRKL